MVAKAHRALIASVLLLALGACGRADENNSESADADITANLANASDPALTAALHDQIMVDPRLGQQANGDAVRPPAQPYSGPIPADTVATNNDAAPTGNLMQVPAPGDAHCPKCKAASEATTLGALAERQSDRRTRGCASSLAYSASWAARLPPDLPLYPQARVTEAAGSQSGGCALRVVSFSAAQPIKTMVDWYYTKAIRSGYTAEHQADGGQQVLGGTRKRDGGAYVIYFTARDDGGTDIDVIANNGI